MLAGQWDPEMCLSLPPHCWISSPHHQMDLITWTMGLWLRTPCLWGKAFTNGDIFEQGQFCSFKGWTGSESPENKAKLFSEWSQASGDQGEIIAAFRKSKRKTSWVLLHTRNYRCDSEILITKWPPYLLMETLFCEFLYIYIYCCSLSTCSKFLH